MCRILWSYCLSVLTSSSSISVLFQENIEDEIGVLEHVKVSNSVDPHEQKQPFFFFYHKSSVVTLYGFLPKILWNKINNLYILYCGFVTELQL